MGGYVNGVHVYIHDYILLYMFSGGHWVVTIILMYNTISRWTPNRGEQVNEPQLRAI